VVTELVLLSEVSALSPLVAEKKNVSGFNPRTNSPHLHTTVSVFVTDIPDRELPFLCLCLILALFCLVDVLQRLVKTYL